ncbi:hypothetical protein ACTQ45_06075 [Fundicoccus sp. Sow4_D5]|uniref:hypothetical protein n=1 Tax=Fundicoccus sp. Sow4_D5 TaxID=3438782 RepID=UPI003F927870
MTQPHNFDGRMKRNDKNNFTVKGNIMQIDPIDYQSLQLLTQNSRMQWKEIHMTGQAVDNRIQKLKEKGIIQAFTIVIDEMKVGISFSAFIIFI